MSERNVKDMRDQELVNALREHAEWAEGNQWETPITLGDDLAEAADLIEAQAKGIDALRNELLQMEGNVMDAVKFIEERDRMYEIAGEAPSLCYRHEKSAEEIVREVEEWSAAHPRKTRQSVFLEQYPEAKIDKATGVLTICPAELTKECRDDRGACGAYSLETCVCEPCRRNFWMQEVE